MELSKELIHKYHMATLEEEKMLFGDTIDTEIEYYKTFLIQTDHIPNKIFETFVEDMAAASALETIGVIVNFFKEIKTTYGEILKIRKYCREQINELQNM